LNPTPAAIHLEHAAQQLNSPCNLSISPRAHRIWQACISQAYKDGNLCDLEAAVSTSVFGTQSVGRANGLHGLCWTYFAALAHHFAQYGSATNQLNHHVVIKYDKAKQVYDF
jgi:hypothetical protein